MLKLNLFELFQPFKGKGVGGGGGVLLLKYTLQVMENGPAPKPALKPVRVLYNYILLIGNMFVFYKVIYHFYSFVLYW